MEQEISRNYDNNYEQFISSANMYLIRKLFWFLCNPKPTKTAQFFLDNQGRKIWYFWGDDPINALFLRHRGRWIGKMQFIFQENALELGDIEVFERYPQYRNSGIGTQMFRLLVAYAKEHNISRIEGFMKPETKEMWPKLFEFYRSLGCTIVGGHFFYTVNSD